MIEIYFTKMHGNGNDFIIIDNRVSITKGIDLSTFVKTICTRHFHIGADGVMLLERSDSNLATMRYFNSDGSEGEMCGNGARCFARYVYTKGLTKEQFSIQTISGMYGASIIDDELVEISFPSYTIEEFSQLNVEEKAMYFLTVGVPHVVFYDKDIDNYDAIKYEKLARKIRYNKELFPKGTNVNMVERISEDKIYVRTYERGVEEETYACGTGAIASTLITAAVEGVKSPVTVQMKGGELIVRFSEKDGAFTNVTLTGKAKFVFEGRFHYKFNDIEGGIK